MPAFVNVAVNSAPEPVVWPRHTRLKLTAPDTGVGVGVPGSGAAAGQPGRPWLIPRQLHTAPTPAEVMFVIDRIAALNERVKVYATRLSATSIEPVTALVLPDTLMVAVAGARVMFLGIGVGVAVAGCAVPTLGHSTIDPMDRRSNA